MEDEDESEAKNRRHQRNKNLGKSTLMEKRENIQINTDMSAQIDPMFHKTASSFDEYGARGLLMNKLYIQNDCQIIFDSTTKIEQNKAENDIKKDDDDEDYNIEKEQKWMIDLFDDTFAHPHLAVQYPNMSSIRLSRNSYESQFSQVLEYDHSNSFKVDIEWLKHTSACKGIQAFVRMIDDINGSSNADTFQKVDEHMDNDSNGYDSDNDVLMNMPKLMTAAGSETTETNTNMNVSFAINDEYIPNNDIFYDDNINDISTSQIILVPQMDDEQISMEIHPIIQPSDMNNTSEIIANLEKEQKNAKRAMNMRAMNEIISKLESSELDSLTTFYDPKKKYHWAGPEKCYLKRRKSQLPLQILQSSDSDLEIPKKIKKRKTHKTINYINFFEIANGNFIDKELFKISKKSKNTFSAAVEKKNASETRALPNDIKIKPDIFVRLFLRRDYSVWKHLLRQHKIRMMGKKVKSEKSFLNDSQLSNMIGSAIEDNNSMMDLSMDASGVQLSPSMPNEQQILAEQAAATIAVMNASNITDDKIDDDIDTFYNYKDMCMGDDNEYYNNELNISASVDDKCLDFSEWNINGMEMVESPLIIQKLHVQFIGKRKKIDVLKLKNRMWNQFKSRNDGDGDGSGSGSSSQSLMNMCTFRDTMDGLPDTSVPFCFMTMLLLANEKRLILLPNVADDGIVDRSDFYVAFADDSSREMLVENGENAPIMILGE